MALVSHPTPLMLALSKVVSSLDPSVPAPKHPAKSKLGLNAEHWDAVASYAEAFPAALAKRVGREAGEGRSPECPQCGEAPEKLGVQISGEARDIRDTLAVPGLAGTAR